MKTEEKVKHAKEVVDKFLPHVGVDFDELIPEFKKLPFQDIQIVYNDAMITWEKGTIPGITIDAYDAGNEAALKYVDDLRKIRGVHLERLMNDRLWTVIDHTTKTIFINQFDAIYVFSEKELADECVAAYAQKLRTTLEVVEIPEGAAGNFFRNAIYKKGVKSVTIDSGAYYLTLPGEHIISAPDYSNVEPMNIPVTNPDLFRAVAKFQQERLYEVDYEGKADIIKQLEDDVIKAFYHAKFLIPLKVEKPEGEKEEGVVGKGTIFNIPSLVSKNDNEKKATPVFTDWEEFSKAYDKNKWTGWIWKPEELLNAPDDEICLNVGTLAFVVSKKEIQWMLDTYENEFANPKSGGLEAIQSALNAIKE